MSTEDSLDWLCSRFAQYDIVEEIEEEDNDSKEVDLSFCLIGKVLSSRVIPHGDIVHPIQHPWGLRGSLSCKPLDNNLALFVFTSRVDKKRVQQSSPWMVEHNHLLVLIDASDDLKISKLDFSCCSFWVQIHDLPLGLRTAGFAEKVGNNLGRFLSVDRDAEGSVIGRFLRIKVELDVTKPLRPIIKAKYKGNPFLAEVKYERLPEYCFFCGIIGHSVPGYEERIMKDVPETGPWKCGISLRPHATSNPFPQRLLKPRTCRRTPSVKAHLPEDSTNPTKNAKHCLQIEEMDSNDQSSAVSKKLKINSNALSNTIDASAPKKSPLLVFLSETKCRSSAFDLLKYRLGMDCLVVDAIGNSGGLALLWRKDIPVTLCSLSRNHIDIDVTLFDVRMCITCVYGEPDTSLRPVAWSRVKSLRDDCRIPWLCIGDFNEVLSQDKFKGLRPRPARQINDFRSFLDHHLLHAQFDRTPAQLSSMQRKRRFWFKALWVKSEDCAKDIFSVTKIADLDLQQALGRIRHKVSTGMSSRLTDRMKKHYSGKLIEILKFYTDWHFVPSAVPRQEKITLKNRHNEKLVGVLHDSGSVDIVVLCHGFRSSKDYKMMVNIAAALENKGISAFRFDFAGNGESEGTFQYGNYWREVEDVRSVVEYFIGANRRIAAILGHSKGGNIVLLYASKYHDISTVVNVSGRYKLDRGIAERLGNSFLEKIKKEGYIDIKSGGDSYRVTEESLTDRLNTNMHEACLQIDKECRVLTVHGSADEIIPAEDAMEFAKNIPNHTLHIIEGADHGYNSHQAELISIVLPFIEEGLQQSKIH
ncbi:OLC1v1037728C1 [Oldenlandia corymbosa var. corymbosa]|uniref:OLC1v1037728C1 n=1 Tax=Oldenlandia corymbosa var. corymbosa TaxID=529605 RepID=A0AAV1D0R0_OLDCO|nr:OLC1v1037728C1 [Oldenlandia corymbosa var. corymbosa]